MTQASPLTIDHETRDGATILHVSGELDLTNADELADAVESAAGVEMVLDLALLTFLDSAGIRAIDRAHARLRTGGGSLVIVAPPASRTALTLRIAGFDGDFVVDSLDDARRWFDERRSH